MLLKSDAHFVNGVLIKVRIHTQLGLKCVICCIGIETSGIYCIGTETSGVYCISIETSGVYCIGIETSLLVINW